jgi:hypothetical protein
MQGLLLVLAGIAHILWDVGRFVWSVYSLVAETIGLVADYVVWKIGSLTHVVTSKRLQIQKVQSDEQRTNEEGKNKNEAADSAGSPERG